METVTLPEVESIESLLSQAVKGVVATKLAYEHLAAEVGSEFTPGELVELMKLKVREYHTSGTGLNIELEDYIFLMIRALVGNDTEFMSGVSGYMDRGSS